MAKILKTILEHVLKLNKNLKKYFCMFKNTKNISWILQPVCKIPKDFGLFFKKYIKNHFWWNLLLTFNIRIKNLYKVNIQHIIQSNMTQYF